MVLSMPQPPALGNAPRALASRRRKRVGTQQSEASGLVLTGPPRLCHWLLPVGAAQCHVTKNSASAKYPGSDAGSPLTSCVTLGTSFLRTLAS